jgi:hypothetical protein
MRWRCRAAGCIYISVPGETTRNAASRPSFGVRGRALVAAAAEAAACLAGRDRSLRTHWRAISFLVRVRYPDQ